MRTVWGRLLLVPAFAGTLAEFRVGELAKPQHCGSAYTCTCVFTDSFVFAFGLSNDGRALRICVGAERDSAAVSGDKSVPKLLFSALNSFVYSLF